MLRIPFHSVLSIGPEQRAFCFLCVWTRAATTVRLQDDASPGVSPNVDISSPTATALADRRVRIQAVVKVSSATLLFLLLLAPARPLSPSSGVRLLCCSLQNLSFEDRSDSWVRQEAGTSPPTALVSLANRKKKRSEQLVQVATPDLAAGVAAEAIPSPAASGQGARKVRHHHHHFAASCCVFSALNAL